MNNVEAEIAKLAEDESWQSNLTDEERAALLKWAEGRLCSALAMERAHVFGILRLCDMTLGNPTIDRNMFMGAITRGY